MRRRTVLVGAAALAAVVLGSERAEADILIEGTKRVDAYVILDAGRFEDYCEHRWTVREGDTLEQVARAVYGDPARVADLERANPKVAPARLQAGERLVLPPKLAPRADATETLAWQFYARSHVSPVRYFQRLFPGERVEAPGKASELVAIPVARAAEFERLLAAHRDTLDASGVLEKAPWAIRCVGFDPVLVAHERSRAVESTSKFRIGDLETTAKGEKVFRLITERTTWTDAAGKTVDAGFAEWRGSVPLVLIALLGGAGLLLRWRRRRTAARA